jgi:hypothetical protein
MRSRGTFVQHGWDVKHVIAQIMQSHRVSVELDSERDETCDTRNFSRAYRRRLAAEVLLDAVNRVTGVPDQFARPPAGSRAVQAWTYKVSRSSWTPSAGPIRAAIRRASATGRRAWCRRCT